MGGCANTIKQRGKGSNMMRKQQGTQGQGGGLITPPYAQHCSSQLSSYMTANNEQAKGEAEAQAMNPFNALCMEEDDDSEDDEEMEEMEDMQISPVYPGQISPHHLAKKHTKCKDSSVGLMRHPAT